LVHRIDKAVFVDRYGFRRRVVICAGVAMCLLLVGWLLLVGVGVLTAVAAG
jgi:hypothetical protein